MRDLQEADRLLGEGAEIADVARPLKVAEAACHWCRAALNAEVKNVFGSVVEVGADTSCGKPLEVEDGYEYGKHGGT